MPLTEMKVALTADSDHVIMTARIIAKHLTALAHDLETLKMYTRPQFVDNEGRPVDGEGNLIQPPRTKGETP